MTITNRLHVGRAAGCLTAALCLLLAGPAAGQDATTRPADGGGDRPDLNVNEAGTVELHVQGADLRRVLQLLSTQSKINIIATKEVQGTVTADLYDVTFTEALEAVLRSAGFWYVRKGNFITVMTLKQYEAFLASKRQLSVKVFKLHYMKASDAKTLVAPVMSKDGTLSVSPDSEVGIATSSDSAGGNSLPGEDVLVVSDYPENLERITAILKEVDVRPLQVLVEATILRANLDEDNALGVDFAALAGVDFQSLTSTSTGYNGVTLGAVPASKMDDASGAIRTSFNSDFNAKGLKVGFITNNIAFFIAALESITDTTVMGNPKLLVMNKQRGEVLVGSRDGYITTTFTETTATQSVEFLETGTKLVLRPFVARDGYVRMEIHPEVSDGGVDDDGLPFETTTEVTSNVLVKDGHTIVIGGLFREGITNTRTQVPGLGNLPGLGYLFRRIDEDTTRQEVIVLITPHIIKHSPDEAVSQQLKDQVLRFRITTRQGLMWFGRERLAQSHLRWARQHVAAGETGKALWDLDMALSLEPRFTEAIRLKERLTKQAIWANEGQYSSIDWVIGKMILQDLGRPQEEMIVPLRPRMGHKLRKEVRDAMGIGERRELPLNTPPPIDEPIIVPPDDPSMRPPRLPRRPTPTTRPARVRPDAPK